MQEHTDSNHQCLAAPEAASPLDLVSRRFSPVLHFVRTELFGSLLLVAVTAAALVLANSPASQGHFELVHGKLNIVYEGSALTHTLQEWVNDALMTLFFFLIGLEIKREIVTDRLQTCVRSFSRRSPPLAAWSCLARSTWH